MHAAEHNRSPCRDGAPALTMCSRTSASRSPSPKPSRKSRAGCTCIIQDLTISIESALNVASKNLKALPKRFDGDYLKVPARDGFP